IGFVAVVCVSLLVASKIAAQSTTGVTVEMERVIVTGSNIPSAEKKGPKPVDTKSPADLEKKSRHNSPELHTNPPPKKATTSNQNAVGGGDGAVIPNLRGLLPKETLVLIDGKRAAIVGIGGAVSANSLRAAGVDINLIPFPMVDHIDILKDGASAVYGSDA